MSYFRFYGLSMDPFDKNSMIRHSSFPSRDHDHALNELRQGVEKMAL